MADTIPTLTDGILTLRAPTNADVDARLKVGNHAEIQHMYGVPTEDCLPVTRQQAENWVSFHLENAYSWFIVAKDRLIGVIFLHSVESRDRRATLAMGLLHPSDLGQGYGTRALRLVLSHAFGTMTLHRLSLRVLAYNARAIACYQKVGFRIEGRERQSARVGCVWHDDVMMGILAADWRDAA